MRPFSASVTATMVLLLISIPVATQAQETRPGVKKYFNDAIAPRIVGGTEAPPDFYKFPVSLVTNSGFHFCGGSIIAPNIILSAAHCQGNVAAVDVGRHDRESFTEGYERIAVIREIPHPDYRGGESIRFDQMILVLSRSVTEGVPIAVNRNPDLPAAGATVKSMGWGLTQPNDDGSASPILLEVDLTALSNSVCDDSKNPSFPWSNYQGAIYDDMVCAREAGKDSCQGDSGGPLIMDPGTGPVQVGVVSWGYGCADEFFPGVYSRTSYDIEWIDFLVCEFGVNAPADFGCGNTGGGVAPVTTPVSNPVAAPVASPIVPPTSAPVSAPVATPEGFLLWTLRIQMDQFPEEVGWRLERIGVSTEIIESRQPGVYTGRVSQLVEERLFLEEGGLYTFLIFDIKQDGICCGIWGDGNYEVLLEDQVIVSSDGNFGSGASQTFVASSVSVGDTPAPAPLQDGDLFLQLEIQFDEYPQESSWVLRRDSASGGISDIIAFKPARAYGSELASQSIVETIRVGEGGDFTFHFIDEFGDGLCCQHGIGFYRLYNGQIEDNQLLKEGNLEGTNRESTSFVLSGSSVVPPPPTSAPVNADPTISPAPTSPFVNVEVRIQPDSYPDDIGWKIEDSQGRTIKFVGIGTYTTMDEIVETVGVESNSVFKFTIFDEFENGLCCRYGEGFYTVSTAQGEVGYGDQYRSSSEVVFTTGGEIPVEVSILTDDYPEETGWVLQRLDLSEPATVATVPFGTYESQVREDVGASLSVSDGGFYRFEIADNNQDGNCCQYGQGHYGLSVDGQQVLAEESFQTTSEYFHFYVGDPLPTITNPRMLTLEIAFDNYPKEFAWVILQNEMDIGLADSRAIRLDNLKIIAHSPSSYGDNLATRTLEVEIPIEQIPANVARDFTLLTFDGAGDGLCCQYGQGSYTLYDGSSATGTVMVTGTGAGTDMEYAEFTLSEGGVLSDPTLNSAAGSAGSIVWILGVISSVLLMTIF